jgi:hypothetical protein
VPRGAVEVSEVEVEVSALAINVTIPEHLRWTDTRRGEEFTLTTLNIRLLPDGHLPAKEWTSAGSRPNPGPGRRCRVLLDLSR